MRRRRRAMTRQLPQKAPNALGVEHLAHASHEFAGRKLDCFQQQGSRCRSRCPGEQESQLRGMRRRAKSIACFGASRLHRSTSALRARRRSLCFRRDFQWISLRNLGGAAFVAENPFVDRVFGIGALPDQHHSDREGAQTGPDHSKASRPSRSPAGFYADHLAGCAKPLQRASAGDPIACLRANPSARLPQNAAPSAGPSCHPHQTDPRPVGRTVRRSPAAARAAGDRCGTVQRTHGASQTRSQGLLKSSTLGVTRETRLRRHRAAAPSRHPSLS
jgi:hypothetical protein